jgi:replicative DNA helicase
MTRDTGSKVTALRELGATPPIGHRAPPHNYEAEQALLGAIIENSALLDRVRGAVRAEDFAEPIHGRIFAAIEDRARAGHAPDLVTLKNFFETDGSLAEIGGAEYLSRLVGSVVTIINVPDYARTIRELADRRRLSAACQNTIERISSADSHDDPVQNIAADLSRDCDHISASGARAQSGRDVRIQIVEDFKRERACYNTGLAGLDVAMAGGLYAGRAYGIAGRKKDGKTCLAGTISYNLNLAGVPHLYVCCEMSAAEIEHRNIGRALGFNALAFLNERTRNDPVFQGRVAQYAVSAPSNVLYEDRPGIAFTDLRACVEGAATRHGIRGFVVDQLQLITGWQRVQNRAEFLDEVSQWIATVCRKRDIWALVLAQINQDETKPNVRGGEGMRLAFDQVYALRSDQGTPPRAWLEMWDTRYTHWRNIGSEAAPALLMNTKAGPFFEETSGVSAEQLKMKGVN